LADTITDTTPLDQASPRRLVRVTQGRWLGGVCAGLGRYFDVNPLVYRIAFAALLGMLTLSGSAAEAVSGKTLRRP